MASSSENEVIYHPYQYNDLPGPKGAFECRQVDGGLYVRVDMPGVPPDGLTLRPYSDTRTVTFTGKPPVLYEELEDNSDRVYGGYVALDRDPLEVDINSEVKNGCLRLFFRDAEGSPHSLGPKKPIDDAANADADDELDQNKYEDLEHREWIMNDDDPDKETRELKKYLRKVSEDFPTPYKAPTAENMKGVRGGNFAHINPFVLSGSKGVYEAKTGAGDKSGLNNCTIYTRVDMPGIGRHKYVAHPKARPSGGSEIIFEAEGRKESPYDEGGRKYVHMGYQKCSCCMNVKLQEEVKDGVYRVISLKARIGNKPPKRHLIDYFE